MRILGVDPGLKATGYGVIDVTGPRKFILREAGSIEPKQKECMSKRVQKIHQGLTQIIEQYHPDVLVLEKLYAHYKYTTTAAILGHARGVICLTAAEHDMMLIELSVKRVRKAVVGNGNASKQQTQQTVGHILKMDVSQLSLDASDALALALGHATMNNSY